MFQKVINSTLALGSAGQIPTGLHSFCDIKWGVAVDATCVCGGFVQTKQSGAVAQNEVVGASGQAITGEVLGVVLKDSFVSGQSPSALIPQGANLQYITQGNVLIETENPAKQGQYVCLAKSNGALQFTDDISSGTLSDKVFTGWRVFLGTGENDLGGAVNTDAGHDIIWITTAFNK